MSRLRPRLPLLLLALVSACGESVRDERPSAILVSIDTLRADHVGAYGYARDTTPYLDLLAKEGIVFERAFTSAPWTLIAHATMLTGLYPQQHGVLDGDLAVNEAIPFVAERLHGLGYQTVALYYEGWIHARHGFDRGFDVFLSHENAEQAGEHLEQVFATLDPRRPFFLFLHLFDVHSGPLSTERGPIYDCPPPYDSLFMEDAVDALPDLSEGELWLAKGVLDDAGREALTALYDGGIRYVDDKLKSWFGALTKGGWMDDTLVIVTSDHGESLGQRRLGIRDHGGPYQEGLHVPLIVRLPDGARAGERIDATTHLADVVPTILDWTGAGVAEELPGYSLLAPLPDARRVYARRPGNFEAVVLWPNKFVRMESDDRSIRADLEGDPEETIGHPLASDEFDAARDAFLSDPRVRSAFPPAVPVEETSDDEELQRRLEKMGYAGETR